MENLIKKNLFFGNELSSRHVVYNDRVTIRETMCFTKCLTSQGSISFEYQNKNLKNNKNIEYGSIIFGSFNKLNIKFLGDWVYEKYPLKKMITLLAFLDLSKKEEEKDLKTSQSNRWFFYKKIDNCGLFDSFYGLFHDYLMNSLDNKLNDFFSYLRSFEEYWLACFLITVSLKEDKEFGLNKLYDVSKAYGVSESYFRMLGRRVFDCSTKTQLRKWRAANSIIQLIEGSLPIEIIAGNNGYASSSHFSSEIKSFYGLTPKQFKKLERLFNDKD